MDVNLSLHLKMFSDKVKVMNQSNAKTLMLSAAEARSLYADIFELLNHCATLSRKLDSTETNTSATSIQMDGGGF